MPIVLAAASAVILTVTIDPEDDDTEHDTVS
jgi:hypothetical protein